MMKTWFLLCFFLVGSLLIANPACYDNTTLFIQYDNGQLILNDDNGAYCLPENASIYITNSNVYFLPVSRKCRHTSGVSPFFFKRLCGNPIPYFGFEADYERFRAAGFSFGTTLSLAGTAPFPPTVIDQDLLANACYRVFGGIKLPFSLFGSNGIRLEISGSFFDDQKIRKNIFTAPELSSTVFPPITGERLLSFFGGDFTFNTQLTRDYLYREGTLKLFSTYAFRFLRLEPFIEGSLNKFNQNYHLAIAANGILATKVEERLKTSYYDLGGGLLAELPLFCGFSILIRGGAFASYAHSVLKGTQVHVTLGNFSIEQEKHTWNHKWKSSAELRYYFKRRSYLALVGNYEYWGYLPKVHNPQLIVPSFVFDGPAHIQNTFSWNYSIGGKFCLTF